jgi:hypothetical protein
MTWRSTGRALLAAQGFAVELAGQLRATTLLSAQLAPRAASR